MLSPDERVSTGLLLDFYGEMLTPRQREIMGYCYVDDLSLAEIAEITGLTRQGVHAVEVRCKQILTDYERRLGLLHRFLSMKEDLRRLVDGLEAFRDGKCSEIEPMIALAQSLLEKA